VQASGGRDGATIAALDRLLGLCERAFLIAANTCLATMLVINTVNIASRAVFDKAIPWVFPWSVVLFVWMCFLGFFVLYRQRRDITVDFLIERLGEGARRASRLAINAIVIALMAVMLWHMPEILDQQVGDIEMVGLERYTMSLPLFVSCALIVLEFVIDTVRALRGQPEHPGSPAGDI